MGNFELVAAAAIAGIIAVYGYYDAIALRLSSDLYRNNAAVRETLRELIKQHGPPETVTVMAGQEQHCFLHDTRFRTFHSAIETRDFGKTLDLISPDIVLLRMKDLQRVRTYLRHDTVKRRGAGKASPNPVSELAGESLLKRTDMREFIGDALADHGYVRYGVHIRASYESQLLIFVRAETE